MSKFWIKVLSNILFFYSREKRKCFRGKWDADSRYVVKMRKRGIRIGNGTFLESSVKIRDKGTRIGAYCSIARNVTIGTGRHPLEVLSTHSMVHRDCYTQDGPLGVRKEHRVEFDQTKPVTIGSDVWIGMGAVIMDGITVGNGAVIGTHAIVTKDVPPYAVVAGVPAKILRYRFDEKTIERLEQTRWFDLDAEQICALPVGDVQQCLEILEKRDVKTK